VKGNPETPFSTPLGGKYLGCIYMYQKIKVLWEMFLFEFSVTEHRRLNTFCPQGVMFLGNVETIIVYVDRRAANKQDENDERRS
jgi:hypothetical protein